MKGNMNKTNVMISKESGYRLQMAMWCGRCVGRISIQCANCQKLVHRKCSGIKST